MKQTCSRSAAWRSALALSLATGRSRRGRAEGAAARGREGRRAGSAVRPRSSWTASTTTRSCCVTAKLDNGERVDVTRMVEPAVSGDLASVSPTRRRAAQGRRRRADHVHASAARSIAVPVNVSRPEGRLHTSASSAT